MNESELFIISRCARVVMRILVTARGCSVITEDKRYRITPGRSFSVFGLWSESKHGLTIERRANVRFVNLKTNRRIMRKLQPKRLDMDQNKENVPPMVPATRVVKKTCLSPSTSVMMLDLRQCADPHETILQVVRALVAPSTDAA